MSADSKGTRKLEVVTRVLAANDRLAESNRALFARLGLTVVDVMGGPGSGKTRLLERTVDALAGRLRVGVIVGDIATTRDADRIAAHGVPAVQIVTESFGGACHLEASTIAEALPRLDVASLDLLFVENVGNLVCPAEFDLGQKARVVVLSVAEGEEKPLKYPLAFRVSDLAVVSKIDLAPHLDTDLPALRANLREIRGDGPSVELSAKTGEGMERWLDWLDRLRDRA